MGEKENRLDVAKQYLARAHEKLESANILLLQKRYDDAISRAYYAAFLAAKGILFYIGENPLTHAGLLTLFGIRIVKAGLISKEYAKILTELFEARQTSDYQPLVWYSEEDGKNYYAKGDQFVKGMEALFKKMSS